MACPVGENLFVVAEEDHWQSPLVSGKTAPHNKPRVVARSPDRATLVVESRFTD